jgi:hypothetical protein
VKAAVPTSDALLLARKLPALKLLQGTADECVRSAMRQAGDETPSTYAAFWLALTAPHSRDEPLGSQRQPERGGVEGELTPLWQ